MVKINLTGMILKRRYCILEEAGSGGEGHLYLARDMELGNYWAVKELPIGKKREARLLRLLEHPSIPRMVDYVENGDYCYLVMEYIRGKSLGKMLEEGHVFLAEELLSYGDTVLQVLEYLHRQKPPIYYGDLKPDNLMLSDSGKLYVVDFGSAVFGFGESQRICAGTEGFAAPEQYEGKINETSDLYALGKTFQKLIGKHWLPVFWKMPGVFLFIYRCVQPQETRRFKSAIQARKMLCHIEKRKGLARKNIAMVLGTTGVLLMAGLLLGGQEKKPDFETALAVVTEEYYGLEQSEDKSARCAQIEEGLQKLQKEFTKDEEQQKLLLLLAANAELQREWEKAAVYYEQLLLYAPEFAEGYGKYGLFLLRRGQESSSRRLLAAYKQRKIAEENCKSIEIWEWRLSGEGKNEGGR
ncbi:protein kinase domain-containing protein [Blautia sp. HCP3S3_H10_1]|uniref:protein kinase domain-containing protein n=1 Tax=unclassified Blautia TaxID=2648079 RepID=UPI003F8F03A3|nr:serine/threonine-protein kinase [Clostridia bacterium]